MSVNVILEVQSKPENIQELTSTLQHILPDTRSYDGCAGVQVIKNQDNDLNLLIFETWKSRQHYEVYLAWRTETGALEALGALLSQPPSIRYFDAVDI